MRCETVKLNCKDQTCAYWNLLPNISNAVAGQEFAVHTVGLTRLNVFL